MTQIVVLIIIFLMAFGVSFLYFRGSTERFSAQMTEYVDWIAENLDSMFYRLDKKSVWRLVVISMITGGVIGFFLPGKFSEIDKLTSINRAIKLNKKVKYKEAELILGEFKKMDSPIIHNELGVAYLGLDNYEWAEKELKEAIDLLPNYSKAHFNLGVVYTYLGKNMDASFEFSKAKETSKFLLTEKEIYNLTSDLWNSLTQRIIIAAFLIFAGYKLPRLVINFIRSRRMAKFETQLPEGLTMAANGLRAGFSLLQALDVVSKEGRPPLSQEFEVTLKEHRLGAEMEEALKHLYERMPTMDNKIFVNSILILKQTGGNLTEIFDTLAATIQERKRVYQKIDAMTAEGKSQAYILAVLPIVLGMVMDSMNPESFSLMYTTFLGWMLIIMMAVMEFCGLYWMLKIVKVKV